MEQFMEEVVHEIEPDMEEVLQDVDEDESNHIIEKEHLAAKDKEDLEENNLSGHKIGIYRDFSKCLQLPDR